MSPAPAGKKRRHRSTHLSTAFSGGRQPAEPPDPAQGSQTAPDSLHPRAAPLRTWEYSIPGTQPQFSAVQAHRPRSPSLPGQQNLTFLCRLAPQNWSKGRIGGRLPTTSPEPRQLVTGSSRPPGWPLQPAHSTRAEPHRGGGLALPSHPSLCVTLSLSKSQVHHLKKGQYHLPQCCRTGRFTVPGGATQGFARPARHCALTISCSSEHSAQQWPLGTSVQ